jgi:hypothetical protein
MNLNPTRSLWASALVLATGLLTPALTLACDDGTSYEGGGYRVTIGSDGSYYGCNAKDQCLSIPTYAHQTKGRYTWENKGTTYIMTPINSRRTPYRLRVVDRRQRVLVNQPMKASPSN